MMTESSGSGKRMKRDSSYSRVRMAWLGDMMGGKPSCNVTAGLVCPTLTCGRASVNDIHVVCYRLEEARKVQ